MTQEKPFVLALDGRASSVKFASYESGVPLRRLRGKIERIRLRDSTFIFEDSIGCIAYSRAIDGSDHSSAASALINWLEEGRLLPSVKAVGHRV